MVADDAIAPSGPRIVDGVRKDVALVHARIVRATVRGAVRVAEFLADFCVKHDRAGGAAELFSCNRIVRGAGAIVADFATDQPPRIRTEARLEFLRDIESQTRRTRVAR